MFKHAKRVSYGILILGLAALTCNMPSNASEPEPTLSAQEIADTAVARALTAQAGAAPSATVAVATLEVASPTSAPVAAQCSPTVTANTDANVRAGPGTAYDIVGNLPTGGVAAVAGRDDTNSWWYILFAGGPGGYAWIAGSVVTPSCIPTVVQVVAGPPLPAAPLPTATLKFSLGPLLMPGLQYHFLPSPTPVFEMPNFEFELPDLGWP